MQISVKQIQKDRTGLLAIAYKQQNGNYITDLY